MCFDNLKNFSGDVIILSGDVPLISVKTLTKLSEIKKTSNSKASILTAELDNPYGYGRIIRNNDGSLKKIKEHKDCIKKELLINEINAGIYIINNDFLFRYIPKISNQNAQNEYYLPDLINLMITDEHSVAIYKTNNIIEISGINNQTQLSELEDYLNHNEKK